jgi:hypothetical protein
MTLEIDTGGWQGREGYFIGLAISGKIVILHYIPETEIWTSSRSGRRPSAAATAVQS